MIDALASFEGKTSKTLLGFSPIKVGVVDKKHDVTDDVPVPHISLCGHGTLVALYFLLCSGYLAYAIHAFVTRPEVETFTQQPSSNFDPPTIRVGIQCFDSPGKCGDVTVVRDYRTAGTRCPEKGTARSDETHRTLSTPLSLPLCFVPEDVVVSTNTGEQLETPGVSIDFRNITAGSYGAVLVEVSGMRKLVNMDAWQVKTFYIGMSVTKRGGSVTDVSYYAQNLQYDGKRKSTRATYMVRLAQFANVYEVTRPGSWIDVLAQLGGAATVIAAFLLLTEPLMMKLFPGGEQRLLRGRMQDTRRYNGEDDDVEAVQQEQMQPQQRRNPLPSLSPSFSPSQPVEVLYSGHWYNATVLKPDPTNNRFLQVKWEDGTYSDKVPVSAVKPRG